MPVHHMHAYLAFAFIGTALYCVDLHYVAAAIFAIAGLAATGKWFE